jgi:hypothetical protein
VLLLLLRPRDEDGAHVFASELWQHERNVELARQAGLL